MDNMFNFDSDLQIVCRICLQKDNNILALFADDETSKTIRNKMFLCFQIVLSPEEQLPSAICSGCSEELNVADNFRLKCVASEIQMNRLRKTKGKPSCPVDDLIHEADNEELIPVSSEPYDGQNVKLHNSDKELHFECADCHKKLKTKASLLKHLISMHSKRNHVGKITGIGANRRYNCTKCDYFTPHSQTLVNHMRRHNGERPYHCQCGKSFTQSSSLVAHQKIHTDTTYFTCSTCGKQFKHAFSLKTHLRVHESGSLPCTICPKVLKSQKSLQDHLYRHYNIRNYSCEECGATFVTFGDLHNHKAKHSMVKAAECHFCGYKTRAKKNLIIHLKRHAGQKTLKCDLCPLTVYTASDLRRHRRIHSREKPFQCPACSQKFSHSPSLNRHMKNIHGMTFRWGDIKPIKKVSVKAEEGLKLIESIRQF